MKKYDITLVFPPYWDYYLPFLSVPCLQASLKGNNYHVKSYDLNIDCFYKAINIKTDTSEIINDYKSDFAKYHIDLLNQYDKQFMEIFYSTIDSKGIKENYQNNRLNDIQKMINFLDKDLLKNIFHDSGMEKNVIDDETEVIGFSCICFEQFIVSCYYAKIVRNLNPKIKIIFGGSMITEFTKTLEETEIVPIFDYCDYMLMNEGESSLNILIGEILKRDPNLSDVPNLCYKDNDGRIIYTELLLEDFSQLPIPDFDGLDLKKYLTPETTLPYQSSRGCFWGRCAFCNHDKEYRQNFRSKAPEKIVEELIQLYKKYACTNFVFVDEAIKPDIFEKLVLEMEKHEEFNIIKWGAYLKIHSRYTDEIIKTAKDNGLQMVFFGVESFNERMLKYVKKGIASKWILPNVTLFHKHGIKVAIWMIGGFPTQTKDELLEDIQNVGELSPYVKAVYYSTFMLSRQCDMFKNREDYNILDYDKDNVYVFKSHNNGNIIDQDEVYNLINEKYKPLVNRITTTRNRFIMYFYKY